MNTTKHTVVKYTLHARWVGHLKYITAECNWECKLPKWEYTLLRLHSWEDILYSVWEHTFFRIKDCDELVDILKNEARWNTIGFR